MAPGIQQGRHFRKQAVGPHQQVALPASPVRQHQLHWPLTSGVAAGYGSGFGCRGGWCRLAPTEQFGSAHQHPWRQLGRQRLLDRPARHQQRRQLAWLPCGRAAFDQVAAQIAHHKAAHRHPRRQHPLQQPGQLGRRQGLQPRFHQQDAAAVGAHPWRPLQQADPMALALQQRRQQQAGTAGPDDGDAHRGGLGLAGRQLGRRHRRGRIWLDVLGPYGLVRRTPVTMTTGAGAGWGQGRRPVPALEAAAWVRKLASNWWPAWVSTLSGWNCTPCRDWC